MRKILLAAADYIADYAVSISQKHQAGVLAANQVSSIHGAVPGIVV